MALCSKPAAITAAKDFLEIVHVQHNVHIIGWMSDAGREYKSNLFDRKGDKNIPKCPMDPHAEWPCQATRVHSHG